jgi:hypothetical protein
MDRWGTAQGRDGRSQRDGEGISGAATQAGIAGAGDLSQDIRGVSG